MLDDARTRWTAAGGSDDAIAMAAEGTSVAVGASTSAVSS